MNYIEPTELFNVSWKDNNVRKRYGDQSSVEALSLSDTDIELLQMGLMSLIKGNNQIVREARDFQHRNPWPVEEEGIDMTSVLEGTAGEAQELLNRLIMLVGRNVGYDGW